MEVPVYPCLVIAVYACLKVLISTISNFTFSVTPFHMIWDSYPHYYILIFSYPGSQPSVLDSLPPINLGRSYLGTLTLTFSNLSLLDYPLALDFFTQLMDNLWSRGFYKYMMMACLVGLGRLTEARALLSQVAPLCTRIVNGKPVYKLPAPARHYLILVAQRSQSKSLWP